MVKSDMESLFRIYGIKRSNNYAALKSRIHCPECLTQICEAYMLVLFDSQIIRRPKWVPADAIKCRLITDKLTSHERLDYKNHLKACMNGGTGNGWSMTPVQVYINELQFRALASGMLWNTNSLIPDSESTWEFVTQPRQYDDGSYMDFGCTAQHINEIILFEWSVRAAAQHSNGEGGLIG